VQDSQISIPKDKKWKYTNLNPSAPVMRGLPKIHKTNAAIRPVINWLNAPAHKPAKLLAQLISIHIPLPNAFNVKNSILLMKDITEVPYDPYIEFVSFDIENIYSNIPTEELNQVTRSMCTAHSLDSTITNAILHITHTVLEQNYFKFKESFYVQKTGLAMAAPTTSTLSEIYLQYIEHTKIIDILIHHNILGYFRYVDDILIAFNSKSTNIYEVFNSCYNLTPTLNFTMEGETDNRMNFLDITIKRK
jgi:hypothetical protein